MRPKESVSIESASLGGVPGLHLVPEDAVTDRALLYLHGGGYVIGSPQTHKGMVSYIADAMQAQTWLIDYRMGPEAPFPAAVDDSLAAYKALLETHTADNIIIAGDSAGGGLTLATAMKIRDTGLASPAGLVTLSPWANLNQNRQQPMTQRLTQTQWSRAKASIGLQPIIWDQKATQTIRMPHPLMGIFRACHPCSFKSAQMKSCCQTVSPLQTAQAARMSPLRSKSGQK